MHDRWPVYGDRTSGGWAIAQHWLPFVGNRNNVGYQVGPLTLG